MSSNTTRENISTEVASLPQYKRKRVRTNEKLSQCSVEPEANMRKELCVVETRTGNWTWGTLCEAKVERQVLFILIGTYIPESMRMSDDQSEVVIKFASMETKVRIACTRKSILHVLCTSQYNATVVEMSCKTADECKWHGINFLNIGVIEIGVCFFVRKYKLVT